MFKSNLNRFFLALNSPQNHTKLYENMIHKHHRNMKNIFLMVTFTHLRSTAFNALPCYPLDICRTSIHPHATVNSRQFRVPSANPCN